VSRGLVGEFGRARVHRHPIPKAPLSGIAPEAAMTGLSPWQELMFRRFFGPSGRDQIPIKRPSFVTCSEAARTATGHTVHVRAGFSAARKHSHCLVPILYSHSRLRSSFLLALTIPMPAHPGDPRLTPRSYFSTPKLLRPRGGGPAAEKVIPCPSLAHVLARAGISHRRARAHDPVALEQRLHLPRRYRGDRHRPRTTSPLDEATILSLGVKAVVCGR